MLLSLLHVSLIRLIMINLKLLLSNQAKNMSVTVLGCRAFQRSICMCGLAVQSLSKSVQRQQEGIVLLDTGSSGSVGYPEFHYQQGRAGRR